MLERTQPATASPITSEVLLLDREPLLSDIEEQVAVDLSGTRNMPEPILALGFGTTFLQRLAVS